MGVRTKAWSNRTAWIVFAAGLAWMLFAVAAAHSQQTIAPFYTNQANTNIYIKMGQGNPYQTIAQATTKACTAPTAFTVILLPGANPSDTIIGQTGVCSGAVLIDYTAAPAVTYKGNGTGYVSQGSGGGGPPTGAAGGDLSGSDYPNPEVSGIHGIPLCNGFTPTNGQAITLTTASSPNPCWTAAGASSGITALTQDVTASGSGSVVATVKGLNAVPFCNGFTPTNGQLLQYTTGGTPNPCWTAATGGGATIPHTQLVLKGDGAGNGAIGTPQSMGSTLADANSSMLETDANPTDPGVQNVVMGVGAAPNLYKGGTSPFLGGQNSVVIGYNAGHSLTTAREDVIIGDNAAPFLTGDADGSSPEDNVVVCIGSLACGALVNTVPNSSLDTDMIGQKAGVNMSAAVGDTILGNHAGNGVATSAGDVLIGTQAGTSMNTATGVLGEDTYIGSNAGVSTDTGNTTEQNNTVVGFNALSNQGNGSSYNIAIGSQAGNPGSGFKYTGVYNILEGIGVANTNQSFSGSFNWILGNYRDRNMTTATDNISLWPGGGGALTTGQHNLLISNDTDIDTGVDNVVLGVQAEAGAPSGTSEAVAVGSTANAGPKAVAIGGYESAGGGGPLALTLNSIAIGANAVTATQGDIAIGANSGTPSCSGSECDSVAIGSSTGIAGGAFASNGCVELGPGTCTVFGAYYRGVALSRTIASGAAILGTSAIASATCATVVTGSAAGTLTTDVINWTFQGDPTSTTGYTPSASGMLTIISYPTVNTVNFKVCNNTAGSITPGSVTLNWTVTR